MHIPCSTLLCASVFSFFAIVAGQSPSLSSSIATAHWFLHNAEDMHRSFKLARNVQIMQVTSLGQSPKELCTQPVITSEVSRKEYEDSWTSVWVSGMLEAAFNGQCFAASAQSCAVYSKCTTTGYTPYPDERDLQTGQQKFKPESGSLQGVRWAAHQDFVKSWQMEQEELAHQLPQQQGQTSAQIKQATYLRAKIAAASSEVEKMLQSDAQSLVQLISGRIVEFETIVRRTPTVPKAIALPQCFVDFATVVKNLIQAATSTTCNLNSNYWAGLRQQVADKLRAQDSAIQGIQTSSLLQLVPFDYTWRTLEAVLVSVAIALQSVVAAALVEFNCNMVANPYVVSMPNFDIVHTAASEIITKLQTALPMPTIVTAPSAPLQRCLSGRISAAALAISAASRTHLATSSLLSLDFCRQLFDATSHQVISVVPYTEPVPPAAAMSFTGSSTEQREIRFDTQRALAYVYPYASFVARPQGVANSKFANSDKIIKLQKVADANVRAIGQAVIPNTCCSVIDCVSFVRAASLRCLVQSQPCGAGCKSSGQFCAPANLGHYSLAGQSEQKCPNYDSLKTSADFYMAGWPNSSCPFACRAVDDYQDAQHCRQVGSGYYSAACNNSRFQCAIPQGMDSRLFLALVEFTSSGRGTPLGCEVSLAFPLVLAPPAIAVTPPFTIELFVKVSVTHIPSSNMNEFAILAGVFPTWFVGLRRTSYSSVKIIFYHAQVSLTSQGRQTSLVNSDVIPWSSTWHHIAVVVSSKSGTATAKNIHFYCDGVKINSAYRAVLQVAPPQVPPAHNHVFHVGPPNIQLFPTVLRQGRGEPYFNVSGADLFFDAEVDEVRIHNNTLDSLTLGFHLTELSRREACDLRLARLDGACKPRIRFTLNNALNQDRSYCAQGYEPCGSRPGMCTEICKSGMLRQPDCTCDCKSGQFQVWFVNVIHLVGSGIVKNVTIYDAQHRIVFRNTNFRLDHRIDLGSATKVAVIVVRGGASATEVSLDVETASGSRMSVPSYKNVKLSTDRDVILHHARVNNFSDQSFECVACPGQALGSSLPRMNALSCSCADGYDGRNLLGACVPRHSKLQPPVILPSQQYQTAGTRILLALPTIQTQGAWLAVIRYSVGVGSAPSAPNCLSSPAYTGQGLNIIKRRRTVVVRAVLCHPLHFDSNFAEMMFTGNDHLDPPECNASGIRSTASTYALHVNVSVRVDSEPGAIITVSQDGGPLSTYVAPIHINKPGRTQLRATASKVGFDNSMPTDCSFTVDGPSRAVTNLLWLPSSSPGGFVYQEHAFLMLRTQQQLHFELQPVVPNGASLSTPVQAQYRLWNTPLGTSGTAEKALCNWTDSGTNRRVLLDVTANRLLSASATTTRLRIEWRTKETGYVWSSNRSMRIILLASEADSPTIEAKPSQTWNMSDHWTLGPLRDSAIRQVHNVEIQRPASDAQIVFGVGTQLPSLLMKTNVANVSSVRNGGLVDNFTRHLWSPNWSPDDMRVHCGWSTQSSHGKLCSYSRPFQVLAGETVYAFSLQPGKLESKPVTMLIPKELEPVRNDPASKVSVSIEEPSHTIQNNPGLRILASVATTITFALDRSGLLRRSCVLVAFYNHPGSVATTPSPFGNLSTCAWLEYQDKRKLERSKLYAQLHASPSSARSLNVTIFTTIRKPGYLWAYPSATSFLWLRDQARTPAIETVLAPGSVPSPAAMVWLPTSAGSTINSQVTGGHSSTQASKCYFSVNYVNVGSSKQLNWMNAVPNHTRSVPDITDAMEKTSVVLAAKTANQWRNNVELCAWPSLCELPLSGTLSTELIKPPSSLPIVCAWVIVSGLSESEPTCKRIEATSTAKVVTPAFSNKGGVSLLSNQDDNVTEVGTDSRLGAKVLLVSKRKQSGNSIRRLSTWAPINLKYILDRGHPLQYRHAANAEDPANIICCAHSVLSQLQTSASWKNLSGGLPSIPYPQRQKATEHAVFAVYTRLLVGINMWSVESRAVAVVLLGQHPSLTTSVHNRTVVLSCPRATSTILYRWTLESLQEPKGRAGGSVYPLKPGFSSIDRAWELDIRANSGSCVIQNITQELQASTLFGPKLCSISAAATVSLAAPDERRWGFWAAAYSAGLPLSPTVLFNIEAQCIPGIFTHALTPLCAEGDRINSGSSCTPRCSAGYIPSEPTLHCKAGQMSSAAFSCQERPCDVSGNVTNAHPQQCLEGRHIVSGSKCTPHCLGGYVASAPSLTCTRGALLPTQFACNEAPCQAPANIVRAATRPCSGLTLISSGGACTPQCQIGYFPNLVRLVCTKGMLLPANFTCLESPCQAPSGIRAASAPTCGEGTVIMPGQQCTPRCQPGYAPSELSLQCAVGILRPSTFACDEIPCRPPVGIAHGEEPACLEGQRIVPGGTCSARCKKGYVPTHAVLGCANGSLSPDVFACEEEESADAVFFICSMVALVCLVGACGCSGGLLYLHNLKLPSEVVIVENHDALRDWLECVHSVDAGTCVFCGSAPVACQGTETSNGPATIFQSCNFCSEVLQSELGIEIEPLEADIANASEGINAEGSCQHHYSDQPDSQQYPRHLPQQQNTEANTQLPSILTGGAQQKHNDHKNGNVVGLHPNNAGMQNTFHDSEQDPMCAMRFDDQKSQHFLFEENGDDDHKSQHSLSHESCEVDKMQAIHNDREHRLKMARQEPEQDPMCVMRSGDPKAHCSRIQEDGDIDEMQETHDRRTHRLQLAQHEPFEEDRSPPVDSSGRTTRGDSRHGHRQKSYGQQLQEQDGFEVNSSHASSATQRNSQWGSPFGTGADSNDEQYDSSSGHSSDRRRLLNRNGEQRGHSRHSGQR